MELRAYFDILRRRGWIILATALLATVLAVGLSVVQTKIYRATARISAVPARPDWGWATAPKTSSATSSTTSIPTTWRTASSARPGST